MYICDTWMVWVRSFLHVLFSEYLWGLRTKKQCQCFGNSVKCWLCLEATTLMPLNWIGRFLFQTKFTKCQSYNPFASLCIWSFFVSYLFPHRPNPPQPLTGILTKAPSRRRFRSSWSVWKLNFCIDLCGTGANGWLHGPSELWCTCSPQKKDRHEGLLFVVLP